MFKQITVYAALVSIATIGSCLARPAEMPNDLPMPPVIELPAEAGADVAIRYQVADPAAFQLDGNLPTQAKLTEIVTWLAGNFDLPAIYDHPGVELAPAMKIAAMRYKGVLSDRWREDSIHDPAVQAAHRREVVAVYNDTTKTIVLPESWTGATPAELSILVHEMVHHLQNLGKLRYECAGAREKPAYLAQDHWLKLHGLDFEKEFEVDKFTIVVSSACMN